jgi:hypothetical protein
MGDDQHRYAQAERELQRLDRLPAELPAFVQRPDAERGMHHAGAVEQDRDRQELPERDVDRDPGRQRLQRDVAERMVEEMADEIGEQYDAADEADLPQADAAEEGGQSFSGQGGHAIQGCRCSVILMSNSSGEYSGCAGLTVVIPGCTHLGAGPESIWRHHPCHYGFSGAQLRTIALASRAPE